MTDIVERLRDAWGDCHCGTAPLLEAAAEIERLRAERLAFATESEERKAEIERLKTALGPSAAEAWAHMYDENVRLEAEIELLLAALSELADAVTTEVNEKGGGGYILARLSDARRALERKL